MPGTLRPLVLLVWPVVLEQLLVLLVGLSDTYLTGRFLEPRHLAAVTVVAYVLWGLQNCFCFVSIGAAALVARCVGAGDTRMANRVMHQALLVGGALAVVATLGAVALGNTLLGLLQLAPEAEALAARFLGYMYPLLPLMMVELVGIACLRGAGNMMAGLLTMAVINVVNISVSWSLLLGVGGLPRLGWDGVAIGTACGLAAGAVLMVAILARGRGGLQLRLEELRPDWGLMRRILRIGIPGGLDLLSIIGCQLVFLSQINSLGTLASAAHGVALRIESLAYLPGAAFQMAAATLCGQYLGAGDLRRATRCVVVATLACSGLMLLACVVFLAGADPLVHVFVRADQVGVAAAAAPLLRIVSLALVPLAVLMVLSGALRGAGDTRWPLAITLVGLLGVRMPGTWLLAHQLGWGVRGAWWAMVADLVVRCLLVAARFGGGRWKHARV
jgi:putative MATE family efflux protein